MIKFQGHTFEIIAYLATMSTDFDFLIGQKSMYELEGGLDFRNPFFHFMMRSFNLHATENVNINPDQTKTYHLEWKDMPDPEEEHEVIIKIKTHRLDKLVQTLLAKWKNNRILLHATNNSNNMWKIEEEEMMGCLDMRTFGYFHVTGDNLNRIMDEHCKFLSEEETYEYFGL